MNLLFWEVHFSQHVRAGFAMLVSVLTKTPISTAVLNTLARK